MGDASGGRRAQRRSRSGVALWIAHRRGGCHAHARASPRVLAVLTARLRRRPADASRGTRTCRCCGGSCSCSRCGRCSSATSPCCRSPCSPGSFCAQTHIPYLGLVGGARRVRRVGVVAPGAASRHAPKPTARRAPALGSGRRRGGLGVVLWLPPVIDQFVHTRATSPSLADYFRAPPETRGRARARRRRCAPATSTSSARRATTAPTTGPLVDVDGHDRSRVCCPRRVGGRRSCVAWRLRHRPLLALHAVVGAALVLGVVSMSRIFGKVWYYLMLGRGGSPRCCCSPSAGPSPSPSAQRITPDQRAAAPARWRPASASASSA